MPPPALSFEPRILLVEDNPTNLLLARRILEKAGYAVVVAVNGREGVEAARGQSFDIILMDVQMPVLDGCSAAREIRRFPSSAGGIPILALTASVFTQDSQRCFEAGMDDFLGKPFKASELIRKCQLWVNSRVAKSIGKPGELGSTSSRDSGCFGAIDSSSSNER
jgi:CheY-like chemotaxis protein